MFAAALLGGIGLSQGAMADVQTPVPAAADSPRQIVEQAAGEAVTILTDKTLEPEDRDGRLQKLLSQRMDIATLARLTVGKHWQDFSAEQREEFVRQFTDHLLGMYTPLATVYAGQHVQVAEDQPEKSGDHTVLVLVTDRKGPAGAVRQVASIAARMRKGQDNWRAIDVTIEGVSIAQVFRSQFQPVIAKSGIDALIERLRQKNTQMRGGK